MILVIGAGVIGLATAAALARKGKEVLVVERESRFGMGVSSRNSEVIHGGMYYGSGTLRAYHCVRGRKMMVERCLLRGLPHKMVGKLIVATNEKERLKIENIYAQGITNDVEGLSLLTAAEAIALEPALHCTAAVLSENTGIIDAHSFMLSLVGEIEDLGGMIAYNSEITQITYKTGIYTALIDGENYQFTGVVNAASLNSHRVAGCIDGLIKTSIPPRHIAKGTYFKYGKRPVFSRLIYPAPVEAGGLGTHVTLDLQGQMRFGPDLEWVETEDYTVDPARAEGFYASIRTYFPSLEDHSLVPDYAGIRPKINGKGEPLEDFIIQTQETHGLPRLVNLYGIESPGLTSSLSIGETVARVYLS
jgi:L-2-hydroxyglutarate oxidase LhgO